MSEAAEDPVLEPADLVTEVDQEPWVMPGPDEDVDVPEGIEVPEGYQGPPGVEPTDEQDED